MNYEVSAPLTPSLEKAKPNVYKPAKFVVGPPGVEKMLAMYGRVLAAEEVARRPLKRTKSQEARDKWIYSECCRGTKYVDIIEMLQQKPRSWGRIYSVQGIRDIGQAYADRQKPPLPPIPQRKRGRRATT